VFENCFRLLVTGWLAAAFLSGCGGKSADFLPPTPTPPDFATGDAARGEQLFLRPVIGAAMAPGCRNCHLVDSDLPLIGPSLQGVGSRAQSAETGLSADLFLYYAIVDPNRHLTPGYSPDVMYQEYATALTSAEIADLVAFMRSLE
jgi:mono/diheme cytochrome c family protein